MRSNIVGGETAKSDEANATQIEPGRLPGLRRVRDLLRTSTLKVVMPTVRTRLLGRFVPAFDVRCGEEGYAVLADLPGCEEKDVEISAAGHRLTITGRRAVEHGRNGDDFLMRERPTGAFSRSFDFPEEIDAERLQAELKNGVLRVTVPNHLQAQSTKVPLGREQPAKA